MSSWSETRALLQQYYNLSPGDLPQKRVRSAWETDNEFGFWQGILEHGMESHKAQLQFLLSTHQFAVNQETFLDSMFDHYIRPFHKGYSGQSRASNTPLTMSPSTRLETRDGDGEENVFEGRELTSNDFKRGLLRRDGICLFCWNKKICHGAHIIAQKNVGIVHDESSHFRRAGLVQKNEVQNGLLLCVACHCEFDILHRYVDSVENQLVMKVSQVNDDDSESDLTELKTLRTLYMQSQRVIGCRNIVEENGEFALYFMDTNSVTLPNKKALEFHKAACLIWRLAGGAHPREEYDSDHDGPGSVDTGVLKRRFNIPHPAAKIKTSTTL